MFDSISINIFRCDSGKVLYIDDFSKIIAMIAQEISTTTKMIFIDSIHGNVKSDINSIIDNYGCDSDTVVILTIQPDELLMAEKEIDDWDLLPNDKKLQIINNYYNDTSSIMKGDNDFFELDFRSHDDGIHYIYKNNIGKMIYTKLCQILMNQDSENNENTDES